MVQYWEILLQKTLLFEYISIVIYSCDGKAEY